MSAGDYMNNAVFTVTIYDIEMSFSKVSGIRSGAEYDVYVEGGGQMQLLPKPKTSAEKITFEKGISVIDKKSAGIFVAGAEIQNIVINLMKNNQKIESYQIESGIVESWEVGDLDAISPGVAVKKFSIVHTGLRKL